MASIWVERKWAEKKKMISFYRKRFGITKQIHGIPSTGQFSLSMPDFTAPDHPLHRFNNRFTFFCCFFMTRWTHDTNRFEYLFLIFTQIAAINSGKTSKKKFSDKNAQFLSQIGSNITRPGQQSAAGWQSRIVACDGSMQMNLSDWKSTFLCSRWQWQRKMSCLRFVFARSAQIRHFNRLKATFQGSRKVKEITRRTFSDPSLFLRWDFYWLTS